MKNRTTIALVLMSITSIAIGQGSLTPPGAPAPTMKTLDELDVAIADVSTKVEDIESRIDLATVGSSGGYEHYITESGSYYLSGNVEVTQNSGVRISASGVTLDLNGFEISRASGTGGYGIYIAGGMDCATVRNGSVVGFSSGIYTYPITPTEACRFESLAISKCTNYGIRAGKSSRVMDCHVHDNTGFAGISDRFRPLWMHRFRQFSNL